MKASLVLAGIIFLAFACIHNNRNDVAGSWQIYFPNLENKVHLILNFRDDDHFDLEAFEGPVTVKVAGSYYLRGDTFFIKDKTYEPNHQICDYADTGKYIYRRINDSLFFRAILDKCEKRKFVLSSGLVLMK